MDLRLSCGRTNIISRQSIIWRGRFLRHTA
jgi:hypothetical protein